MLKIYRKIITITYMLTVINGKYEIFIGLLMRLM